MKFEERMRIVDELAKSERELAVKKGHAYADDDDTLSNFKRTGERTGVTKYQAWLVYFDKHIDAIETAIKLSPQRPLDSSEGILGRIHDTRVYLSLLACLLAEDGILVAPTVDGPPSAGVTSRGIPRGPDGD